MVNNIIKCSFCGKGQYEVRKLIAGPNKVFICDECVDLCADIIKEEIQSSKCAKQEKKDNDIDFANLRERFDK